MTAGAGGAAGDEAGNGPAGRRGQFTLPAQARSRGRERGVVRPVDPDADLPRHVRVVRVDAHAQGGRVRRHRVQGERAAAVVGAAGHRRPVVVEQGGRQDRHPAGRRGVVELDARHVGRRVTAGFEQQPGPARPVADRPEPESAAVRIVVQVAPASVDDVEHLRPVGGVRPQAADGRGGPVGRRPGGEHGVAPARPLDEDGQWGAARLDDEASVARGAVGGRSGSRPTPASSGSVSVLASTATTRVPVATSVKPMAIPSAVWYSLPAAEIVAAAVPTVVHPVRADRGRPDGEAKLSERKLGTGAIAVLGGAIRRITDLVYAWCGPAPVPSRYRRCEDCRREQATVNSRGRMLCDRCYSAGLASTYP